MRHSTSIAAIAVTGALALAGCQRSEPARIRKDDRPAERDAVRVISRLDCPDRQGSLKRVTRADDGRSCVYAGDNVEVLLRLVSVDGGDAEGALAPIEAELKALMPTLKPASGPRADESPGRNKTSIHLPGIRIDASDDGADIKIGQLTINSNEGGASEVKIDRNVTASGDGRKDSVHIVAGDNDDGSGDVKISATGDGAEIRQRKRGDSIRSTLILASDKAPGGYRVVGYEARGPKGGPLAVATVRAKNRDSGDHDVFQDMKALIRHNVGG